MSKPKAALWDKLVEEAGVEEIDRAAKVTVEEAEAELAAAGFDVAAERAKAAAFLESLEKGTASPATESSGAIPDAPPSAVTAVEQSEAPRGARRERPRPVILWLAAAATLAVAGGAIYTAFHEAPGPAPSPPGPSTPAPFVPTLPDLVSAVDLRRQAAAACDAKDWSVCLAHLDQARTSDPDGDGAPDVKKLREKAIAGILRKPPPPAPP